MKTLEDLMPSFHIRPAFSGNLTAGFLQGRILLEETHIAGSSLGEGLESMRVGDTGVYVGCMYQEYTDVLKLAKGKLNAASATGNSLAFMVGR